MMKPSYELIVFDWDGTLMDSEARIVACMQGAIAELMLPLRDDAAIRNIIGLGLIEAVRSLYPEIEAGEQQALVEGYRHQYLVTNSTSSVLFPGMQSLIESLNQQGYLLAIATGKGRQGLEASMSETGLKTFFHLTRCADETRSKPHPHMLEEIMSVLNVDKNDTLMIGDTEYDIQMAHNAGTDALAVGYGVHETERLLGFSPRHYVDTPEQLISYLLNLAKCKHT